MNFSVLFCLVVLLHSSFVESFSITTRNPSVTLQTAPLIGGPKWLPLHVKVVIDQTHTFDYIPQDATSPATLRQLLSLRTVPAIARGCVEEENLSKDARRAREFCENYHQDLHLVTNNCWTFALELLRHVEKGDARR